MSEHRLRCLHHLSLHQTILVEYQVVISGSQLQFHVQCLRLDQRELHHHLCHRQHQRQCLNQGKSETRLPDLRQNQSKTPNPHQSPGQHHRSVDQVRSQHRDVSLNLLLLHHHSRLLQMLLPMSQTPSLCCRPILETLLVNPVFRFTVHATNPNNVNEPQSHQDLFHLGFNKR